jgi:hypothetical protein
MTTVKPATQLLLVAPSGDPIMAVSRHGLGSTLAYTSDVTDKWGSQWLAWNQFGRFWSQALRGIVRRESSEGLYLRQRQDDDRWTIDITRLDASGQPVTGVKLRAHIVDDTETVNHVTVEEIGLGRYQAVVPVGDAESFSLRLDDLDHDKTAVLHFLPRLDVEAVRRDIISAKIHRPASHLCYFLALIAMLAGLLFRRI